jgi:hypothetical protein
MHSKLFADCGFGRLVAQELGDVAGDAVGVFEPRPVAGTWHELYLRVAEHPPLLVGLIPRDLSVVLAPDDEHLPLNCESRSMYFPIASFPVDR